MYETKVKKYLVIFILLISTTFVKCNKDDKDCIKKRKLEKMLKKIELNEEERKKQRESPPTNK